LLGGRQKSGGIHSPYLGTQKSLISPPGLKIIRCRKRFWSERFSNNRAFHDSRTMKGGISRFDENFRRQRNERGPGGGVGGCPASVVMGRSGGWALESMNLQKRFFSGLRNCRRVRNTHSRRDTAEGRRFELSHDFLRSGAAPGGGAAMAPARDRPSRRASRSSGNEISKRGEEGMVLVNLSARMRGETSGERER